MATPDRPDLDEAARRQRLGIPADAERVLFLTETSHWDPDWLLTSEEYFRLRVRRTLRSAVDELLLDPRRVYSVECVFFLRMFYERLPEYQEHVRTLVNEGRLRMMGSGVTTPDTLIPSTELLVRDYLLGQEWLRANAMTAEPDVAYFPDTFGFTPALPEVLAAVGVARAALCRIDGMFFFGNETERARNFPRPGSSAELLATKEQTLDFVWRGPDGAELLTHWLAFTYGQGDMLAHAGIMRQAGAPLAVSWPSDRHVANGINRQVRKLAPLARTPYLLCPIGMDFTAPIHALVPLLDRYNAIHFPATGTWVVNGGLDDYLALVDAHRSDLPVVEIDPSQYFSGFFTSRPSLKRKADELAGLLLATDALALRAGADARPDPTLDDAWWTAATANHHDFITGTATDRVVRKEQVPWLDAAIATARTALGTGSPAAATADEADRTVAGKAAPSLERDGSLVSIRIGGRVAIFDQSQGGGLMSYCVDDRGNLLGAGPSLGLTAFEDSGGLWRMGQEFAGGRFRPVDETSLRPAPVRVAALPDGSVEVSSAGVLDGHPWRRRVSLHPDDPHVRVQMETTAGNRRCLTMGVSLPAAPAEIVTDVPGGVARRPATALFNPTFWSVQSAAVLPMRADDEGGGGGGLALLLGLPGAVAIRSTPDPTLDVIVARNATKETAYGALPLPAQPARGHDPGPHRFDAVLTISERGDRLDPATLALARSHAGQAPAVPAAITVDRDDVFVLAAKPAHRGAGAIVRVQSLADHAVHVTVRWPGVPLRGAIHCDGRERDLEITPAEDITVTADHATVTISPGLTTIRLTPTPNSR